MFDIKPLSKRFAKEIRSKIDTKTKPIGALGTLEDIAMQLALIQSEASEQWQQITLHQPSMLVFAADHGIAKHPVSIAPSDVTYQMVLNFLSGGAAINCFCRCNHLDLQVIDAGMKQPIPFGVQLENKQFIEQRLGEGTADISEKAAMTTAQVDEGLMLGRKVARNTIKDGANLLMLGEMGIGNTSSASALVSVLLDISVDDSVGLGTGIDEPQWQLKKKLINTGIERFKSLNADGDFTRLLAELGGFEIVQMVGAMLASAEAGVPILVDGFIVSAAALVAAKMHPNVMQYFIFAHQSNEHAHKMVLEALDAKPLLQLSLRLGEGTGAALAFPLLQAAVSFYNDMASFDSAGVSV